MVEEVMLKQMKCTSDWEVYDPAASVVCSCVCIEEYTGFNTGYGTNGYSQMGFNGYGYNNSYTNGYSNMGYSRTDISGKNFHFFIFFFKILSHLNFPILKKKVGLRLTASFVSTS